MKYNNIVLTNIQFELSNFLIIKVLSLCIIRIRNKIDSIIRVYLLRESIIFIIAGFIPFTISAQNLHIKWVEIPSVTFMMGSPTSETCRENDETQHQVTLGSYKISSLIIGFLLELWGVPWQPSGYWVGALPGQSCSRCCSRVSVSAHLSGTPGNLHLKQHSTQAAST